MIAIDIPKQLEVIGGRIKELRRVHKVTQEDMGVVAGVGGNAISSYEHARAWPATQTLLMIAHKYGVSMDWLCGVSSDNQGRDFTFYDEDVFKQIENSLKVATQNTQKIRKSIDLYKYGRKKSTT